MTEVFGTLAVLLAAAVMAPAVAHVLELPGKMRLSRAEYVVVQRIYYPGFTFAGFGEFVAIAVTAVALALTEAGSAGFALRAVALAALAGVQAVYWLRVHPVNGFWLEGEDLDRFSSGFFAFRARRGGADPGGHVEWTALRDRWEYGHATRAVLAVVSLVLLVVALV
ncbi:hypothetical protein ACFPA8_16040 [Streptomyces ovatisporus]|uniref:DUF1772 domain-containing protein n=1 Tax=Streptomyces ovatisporus TaxID=1128682 RepID=A0ABV9A760_9ACTN